MQTKRRTDGRRAVDRHDETRSRFPELAKRLNPLLLFISKFRPDDGYPFTAETCSLVRDKYRPILRWLIETFIVL
jgi:hypothetical protein